MTEPRDTPNGYGDTIVDLPTLLRWLHLNDRQTNDVIPVEPAQNDWPRWFESQGYKRWPRD